MTNDDLALTLALARDALFDSITGLTEEQFRRRPATGDWSVVEVLAHVAAAQRRAITDARAIAATPDHRAPLLSDEERRQEGAYGRRLPPPQIVHDLVGSYRRIKDLLVELAEQQTHEGEGPQQLSFAAAAAVLQQHAEHEIEHAAQIWELRSSFSQLDR